MCDDMQLCNPIIQTPGRLVTRSILYTEYNSGDKTGR